MPSTGLRVVRKLLAPAEGTEIPMDEVAFQEWVELTNLLGRYITSVESNDFTELGNCFTPDAVIDVLGQGGPVCHGRDEAVAAIRARRLATGRDIRRHLLSNLTIQKLSPDRFRCQSSLLVVFTPISGDPSVVLTGKYDDIAVRESDGNWRLASRILRRDTPT